MPNKTAEPVWLEGFHMSMHCHWLIPKQLLMQQRWPHSIDGHMATPQDLGT